MTAEDRGIEMMLIPMGELPPLALAFAARLCGSRGICGEMLLSAWCSYAQEIEGLVCTDDLYRSPKWVVEWFDENKTKPWRIAKTDSGKIYPTQCELRESGEDKQRN